MPDPMIAQTIASVTAPSAEEAEKLLILKTLQSTHNNKTRAAEILGISLKTLHNKLKEYGRPQDAVLATEEE